MCKSTLQLLSSKGATKSAKRINISTKWKAQDKQLTKKSQKTDNFSTFKLHT